MSVWYCISSCRLAAEAENCLAKWRALGYKIAILRQGDLIEADLLIPTGEYLGWARSTNILAKEVLRRDESASWLVGGGDDYFPDSDHEADAISTECSKYFAGPYPLHTWGVMQPVGDRWGDTASSRETFGQDRGAEIDRICGSPWMGREWCEKAYLGIGPMWPGYHHLYADEELHDVAEKLGVLWQRRDLTQEHKHPCRERGYQVYHEGHLAALYSPEAWATERAHFEDRKRKGFPGCEPCLNG